jgi:hypothetical protein
MQCSKCGCHKGVSPERFREVLRYESLTGHLYWTNAFGVRHKGKRAGYPDKTNRRIIHVDGVTFLEHRVIWEMHHGPIPFGLLIDHQDHDTLNNRIENLRLVTRAENQRNMSMNRRNTSGTSGVDWQTRPQKWRARIADKHLGLFDTKEEAVKARLEAQVALGFHKNHGIGKTTPRGVALTA